MFARESTLTTLSNVVGRLCQLCRFPIICGLKLVTFATIHALPYSIFFCAAGDNRLAILCNLLNPLYFLYSSSLEELQLSYITLKIAIGNDETMMNMPGVSTPTEVVPENRTVS